MSDGLPVVYLARHGETAWSLSGQHTGLTDLPLTDRMVSRVRAVQGDVLLFSSAHVLRVLATRWLGLEPGAGRHFLLSTASLSAVGYAHNRSQPVIRLWDDAGHAGM